MKKWPQLITEAAYPGNIGVIEMIQFYQVATSDEIRKMEKIAKTNNVSKFKDLIKKVVKVSLL